MKEEMMSRVVHFEIHADEPERAATFYKSVFGWEIKKWEGPIDYWLVTTGKDTEPGIDGAIVKRQGDKHPGMAVIGYVCTVQVDDLDTTIEKATEAGGLVALPKGPIPGVGYIAYFLDTEGNVFGILEPSPNA